MANLKSAIKRVRINEEARVRNQAAKTKMRTQVKQVERLIEEKDVEAAKTAFNEAARAIDLAIQKGAIHKNNGNRQKSKLAKKIREISA